MTAGRTGLVSAIDLAELDVGKSVTRQQRMSVDELMFGPTTVYKADVSDYRSMFPEMKRISFVFWKTDDQPDHIPKWEDAGIQAEVLRVWKLAEARKLAVARAEELKKLALDKANVGKPLGTLPVGKKKDFKVLQPPEFSFLTQMYGAGRLQLGEVFGLDKVGVEFMQKVFKLDPGQVDVVANQPKSEIYVVRAIAFTPFDELWSNFTAEADEWSLYTANGQSDKIAGLRQMVFEDQSEVSQAWLNQIKADAGFKWDKTAADQRPTPEQQAPTPSPIED
jgi:hypothetical protein